MLTTFFACLLSQFFGGAIVVAGQRYQEWRRARQPRPDWQQPTPDAEPGPILFCVLGVDGCIVNALWRPPTDVKQHERVAVYRFVGGPPVILDPLPAPPAAN